MPGTRKMVAARSAKPSDVKRASVTHGRSRSDALTTSRARTSSSKTSRDARTVSGTSAATIAECFEKGVQGFVSKSSSMQVFTDAIRIVLSGGSYIPPEAVSLMGLPPVQGGESDSGMARLAVGFSPKQRQVFEQLVRGVPNRIIAMRLNMAEGTVKAHLHSIYQILRVHNRAQAILRARELRLTE